MQQQLNKIPMWRWRRRCSMGMTFSRMNSQGLKIHSNQRRKDRWTWLNNNFCRRRLKSTSLFPNWWRIIGTKWVLLNLRNLVSPDLDRGQGHVRDLSPRNRRMPTPTSHVCFQEEPWEPLINFHHPNALKPGKLKASHNRSWSKPATATGSGLSLATSNLRCCRTWRCKTTKTWLWHIQSIMRTQKIQSAWLVAKLTASTRRAAFRQLWTQERSCLVHPTMWGFYQQIITICGSRAMKKTLRKTSLPQRSKGMQAKCSLLRLQIVTRMPAGSLLVESAIPMEANLMVQDMIAKTPRAPTENVSAAWPKRSQRRLWR